MKNKNIVFFVIGVFILFSLSAFAQTKKLREIGRYKFASINDDVSPEEVAKIFLDKYREDIKSGFDLSGYGDLFLPFIDQIKQSAFEEKELAIGDKMMWMLYRVGGDIKIVRDLEWAGEKPLPILFSSVVKGNKRYDFIVPRPCGNIALQKVEEISAEAVKVPSEEPSLVEEEPEHEIQRAKIYREMYPLISDADLYCSFFVLEEDVPTMKIIGAEKEYERVQFNDGDVVYTNYGRQNGLEEGQLFMILELGDKMREFGQLAFRRGRVRIVALEDMGGAAKVENACGPIEVGHYLVPFEEKEGLMGKDLGYDVPPYEGTGLKGKIIFLQGDYVQIGKNAWALIDMGTDDGIEVGQQLLVFRRLHENVPLQIFGNVLVIDAQTNTSTIKVLSCKDVLMKGDVVQVRTD